jgi:hypothetical protein
MKSGNINFLERSGPLQACNGTAAFTITITNYELPEDDTIVSKHVGVCDNFSINCAFVGHCTNKAEFLESWYIMSVIT